MERDALAVVPEAAPRPAPRRPAGGVGTAFSSRPFAIYFAGQAASVSGTFLQQTALGWLVLQATGSAAALGLVLAAGSLPTLLLGPWGGVVADRFELRSLLTVTQIAQAVLAGVLWAVAASGHASVGWLVALGVAAGLVSVVDSPARQAFTGMLVPPEHLANPVHVRLPRDDADRQPAHRMGDLTLGPGDRARHRGRRLSRRGRAGGRRPDAAHPPPGRRGLIRAARSR